MSCLIAKDSIRASTVCKAWYKSSAYIRMRDRHLWFMKYPFSPSTTRPCEMYDPSQGGVTYKMEFPGIACMVVYYSKDGWLLMHKGNPSNLIFFNPFTRQLIDLPYCESRNECAIFTCAPTSDKCLVFGLTNIDDTKNNVEVNTWRVGETKWESTIFESLERFFACYTKIIYSKGILYCLGGSGTLAVFDPSKRTWKTQVPTYDHGDQVKPLTTMWFGTFLVEIKGDIYLLEPLDEKKQVFKLIIGDDNVCTWEGKDRFEEGLTIFGGTSGTESRPQLSVYMRNNLLLSDTHQPWFYAYYFSHGRYLPNPTCVPYWAAGHIFQSLWIEPPKQVLEFL
ncbi:unnamed protein product [Cochlearia groenlandica]